MSSIEDSIQECVAEIRELADRIESGAITVREVGVRNHTARDENGRRVKGRRSTFSVVYEANDE